ncbi:MAG: pyridoxal phosphate-dependent aminotransferase, partial [Firmicutes bacterium]|nr:pyridoxal phosphate-dependent aminotransferase [Bacillota bacterium]
MDLSARARQLTPSPTLAIDRELKRLVAQGEDVVSFGIGEPDFETPSFIAEAGIEAIRGGATRYTAVEGTPRLRAAIVAYLERAEGLRYDPDEVMASAGAKQALYNALLALVNPGDAVLIPAPYWVSYPEQVRLAGGVPVTVPTDPAGGYHLSVDDLRRAYRPDVRGLIINSPNNPTGAVLRAADTRAISDFCQRHDLFVIADEIYQRLTYGSEPSPSLASLPGMRERTVIVNGVSKSYAMTGWRIGFAAGPPEVVAAMGRIQGQTTSNPSSVSQAAAAAALRSDDRTVEAMRLRFAARRALMLEGLGRIPGLHAVWPEGAFYVWVEVGGLSGQYDGRPLSDGDVQLNGKYIY